MTQNQIKIAIHESIVKEIDTNVLNDENKKDMLASNILIMIDDKLLSYEADKETKARIKKELVDEILGYGPITDLLNNETVTEVMVNGPKKVYYETEGKLYLSDVTFKDDDHVMQIIERIISPIGRRIDESVPMVDARLPDGSRVNAIIHPLSITGPTITIRKFSKEPFTINDLVRFDTLTQNMADFLDACVRARLNIIVSGGTGSGKTTTLNVLSSFIPKTDRIVTIEDAAELQLNQDHVITLESRPPNIEGKGTVSIRDLVKNSLRMRPDRIIVGECRSGEALDMLQAMNTGHDGSLTTAHANSPRDVLSRLETMVLMAGIDLPIRAIREQVQGAIDLIIHQARMRDGSRRITHITEIVGMEGQRITMQDIFVYKQTGVDADGKIIGEYTPTGIVPSFIETLTSEGIDIDRKLFFPDNILDI